MDSKNLINGKAPEMFNEDHIIFYKQQAYRNGGDLPLIGAKIFVKWDGTRFVSVRCLNCGGWVEFYNEYPDGLNVCDCGKEFELREDGRVYVKKINDEEY